MPDHKFEREYDRQAIQADLKARILDFTDFSATPPETGIYDEPVRYFKANLKWCKFIFGFLAWAEHIAYWKDAEDELHHAIQQILIFEEGIEGGILMTPDEFKEALCEGLECFTDKWSKRWLSGIESGFAIDEDGNYVPGGAADDADVPEDDPLTPADENAEYESGRASNWAYGIQSIFTKLNTLHGPTTSPATPLADAQFIMDSLYVLNDATAFNTAIADYYARRAASQSTLTSVGVAALAEAIYCGNFAESAIMNYLLELPGEFLANKNAVELVTQMEETQYNIWSKGVEPSTAYRTYACVPIEYEEITLDFSTANNPTKTTNGVWKAGHRMLIEISGSFIDSDVANVVGDGMYSHNTLTNVKTFTRTVFNNDGVATPAQADVPFQASHNYRFTLDKAAGSDEDPCIITGDNGPMAIPNVTGTLTIKITDLGQFT